MSPASPATTSTPASCAIFRHCFATAAFSVLERVDASMSVKHPINSVVGSSGSGTSTVKHTFDQIFRREDIAAASIEGDAFHRFDRAAMKAELLRRSEEGDQTFSHFSIEANILDALQDAFREYGETGKGRTRHYVHNEEEADRYSVPPGHFTD